MPIWHFAIVANVSSRFGFLKCHCAGSHFGYDLHCDCLNANVIDYDSCLGFGYDFHSGFWFHCGFLESATDFGCGSASEWPISNGSAKLNAIASEMPKQIPNETLIWVENAL